MGIFCFFSDRPARKNRLLQLRVSIFLLQLRRRRTFWVWILNQTQTSGNRTARCRNKRYGATAFLVSRSLRHSFYDWRRRRNYQAQRDRDVHVHRVNAQCCEPDVYRILQLFSDVTGQLFVFIVMTVAAAEAAVGLGIIITIFRNRESLDVDDASMLKL